MEFTTDEIVMISRAIAQKIEYCVEWWRRSYEYDQRENMNFWCERIEKLNDLRAKIYFS